MEEVIRVYHCQDAEERIRILRMELDEELEKLYEALKNNNFHRIDQIKARLEEIRKEMLMLEVL
ncbi:hypothetical protein ACFQ4J_07640 [Laceyella tengchongensis]